MEEPIDEDQESFLDGFVFAISVLSSMGHRPGIDSLTAQLASLAKGDLTLVPSPDEVLGSLEGEIGSALSQDLKQAVHNLLKIRKKVDARHKDYAVMVLKVMGWEG